MDPREALTQAREVGKYITDYIKFADAKAGLTLTFTAAVGSVVGATAPAVLAVAKDAGVVAVGFVGAAIAATAISVFMVLLHASAAISPRSDPAQASLVSFPDIARIPTDEYVERVAQASTEQSLRDYSLHNATLARIATAKFKALAMAMRWARFALFGAYATAVMFGLIKTI